MAREDQLIRSQKVVLAECLTPNFVSLQSIGIQLRDSAHEVARKKDSSGVNNSEPGSGNPGVVALELASGIREQSHWLP